MWIRFIIGCHISTVEWTAYWSYKHGATVAFQSIVCLFFHLLEMQICVSRTYERINAEILRSIPNQNSITNFCSLRTSFQMWFIGYPDGIHRKLQTTKSIYEMTKQISKRTRKWKNSTLLIQYMRIRSVICMYMYTISITNGTSEQLNWQCSISFSVRYIRTNIDGILKAFANMGITAHFFW